MKKILAVILLTIVCLSSYANTVAPEYTNELLDMCNSSNPVESEKCSGYIWGVGDTLNTEYVMNDGQPTFDFNRAKYAGLNVASAVIALKHLVHANPDKLNQPCVTSVIEAFQLLGVWKYKA